MFTLKVHQKNTHTIIMCSKQNCEFEGTPPEVRKHIHSRHDTGKSRIEEKCTKCEKVFTSRQGLLYHKKRHEEVEAKAQDVEIPAHERPGIAPALPLPQPPATKLPVTTPKPKLKKAKRKKEIPTLPAPSCEYEQIRADNVAAKERLLKSLNGSYQLLLGQQQSGGPQQEQEARAKVGSVTWAPGQPGAPGQGQAASRPQGPEHGDKAPPDARGSASSTTGVPAVTPPSSCCIQLTGLGLGARKL